jgi:hypothetical protein
MDRPFSSTEPFPSTSTLSEQGEQQQDHQEEGAIVVLIPASSTSFEEKESHPIGLSLLESKEEMDDNQDANNNNNNQTFHPQKTGQEYPNELLLLSVLPSPLSRTEFTSEVVKLPSLDDATVITMMTTSTTATSSSSSSSFSISQPNPSCTGRRIKLAVQIFLIPSLVMVLTTFTYHQMTYKLTLPCKEAAAATIAEDAILNIPLLPDNNNNNWNATILDLDRIRTNNSQHQQHHHNDDNNNNDDCIYVPGGGFSGFWFTLGRLSALSSEQLYREKFVCYSAGCLGVVATLLQHLQQELEQMQLQQQHQQLQQRPLADRFTNLTSTNATVVSAEAATTTNGTTTRATTLGHEELYAMARAIQVEWLEGSLHRYDVVEAFIDRMMASLTNIKQRLDDNNLHPLPNNSDHNIDRELTLYQRFLHTIQHNLYIVTTKPSTMTTILTIDRRPQQQQRDHRWLFWQATLQRPQDEVSLKRMLLQTTWIPLAVGSSFTHQGHLDGAFSVWQHPSCRRDVGLIVPKRKQALHHDDKNDGNSLFFSTLYSYWILLSDAWKLWSNTLNVNLGKEDVEALFQMGLEYGV